MSVQGQETGSQGRSFWEENKVLILGIGLVVLVLVCFGLGMLGILWKGAQPQQIGPMPTLSVTPPVSAIFTPIPTDTPVLPDTPTLPPTPLPEAPSCTTSVGMNIRAGPGPDYPDIGDIPVGRTVGVIGQNFRNDVVWWKIGHDSCVSGKYCIGNEEAEAVEFAPAPPTPAPVPPSGSLLVWMRLPDTALEEITMAQRHTVADAFQGTVRTLAAVLEASGRDTALVTSDHGYLYARSATQYWSMPFGVEDTARSTFPRSSRVRPLTDEQARGLRDRESLAAEQRFFAFGEMHATIRGRYWWGSASPNDRCTAHGGLSFVECLVPVLRIWRR